MSSEILNIENLQKDFEKLLSEFFSAVKLKPNSLIVLGCSTSEICGNLIGKGSHYPIGEMIVQTFAGKCFALQHSPAVQCCEHLNRALVMEESTAIKNNLSIVSAVPYEKAGGSAAAAAYARFNSPALTETIQADAGIDIGDTFIGMHLKQVAVPIRLSSRTLGRANITFAYVRPKYIGGERAKYY